MAEIALQLLSSMATRELLQELAAQYTATGPRAINAQAVGGIDVARRVRAGEALDVVVLARDAIEQLIAEGSLLAGSRSDIAKSAIAVAVQDGVSAPDISSEAALRHAVETAATIGYSTGPSGNHLEKLFARWGILEALRPRIVIAPPGVPVGSLLASGAVALGFQQFSEFIALPGVHIVGPLPQAVQTITTFSGAIAASCVNRAAASALLAFLGAPETRRVKLHHGMDSP